MKYSALERTAPRDNPPSEELLSHGVWMPRKPFLEVEEQIVNYVNGQTKTLPYSIEYVAETFCENERKDEFFVLRGVLRATDRTGGVLDP
jgi:hypothetical protein